MEETFAPKTTEHAFKDEQAFLDYLAELDPVDGIEETTRQIDWGPFKRECRDCGKEFVTDHPATFYCEKHRKGSSMNRMKNKKRNN